MSVESNSDDGSDIFWPGFVDAVTNLVLNLLFMLTIMIVAVFMFALELSRHKDDDKKIGLGPSMEQAKSGVAAAQEMVSQDVVKAKDTVIEDLQKQLEILKNQAASQNIVQNEVKKPQKVVVAKTPIVEPEKDLEKFTSTGGGVIVQFIQDAVTLSDTEAETLRKELAAIAAGKTARIEVVAPAGFSEAKRLGFYRAMAVRNLLIAMEVPADKIEVAVREGKAGADNSKVLVSPR